MSQSAQIVSVQLICMFAQLANLIRTSLSMLMIMHECQDRGDAHLQYISSFEALATEKVESIRGAVVL